MELSPTTQKYILHWGEMGTRWGVNRTVAQIHALLFLSERPLHAEEIAEASAAIAQPDRPLGRGVATVVAAMAAGSGGGSVGSSSSAANSWRGRHWALPSRQTRVWAPIVPPAASARRSAAGSGPCRCPLAVA